MTRVLMHIDAEVAQAIAEFIANPTFGWHWTSGDGTVELDGIVDDDGQHMVRILDHHGNVVEED